MPVGLEDRLPVTAPVGPFGRAPRPRRNVPEALRTETLRFFGPARLRAALSAWGGSPLKGCSFGSFLAASTVRNGNGMPPAGRASTVRDEQVVFCGAASLHGGVFFLCKKGEEQRSSPLSFGFRNDRDFSQKHASDVSQKYPPVQ